MNAVILSIGDELVLGQTVDTNAAWLSDRLVACGVMPVMHVSVADDRGAIAEAIRDAAERTKLVIATGGLGPTEDDLTRFALADAMGVELAVDETALGAIEEFFRARGRTMIDRNRVQAMKPAGATMLENPLGTAPGIRALIGETTLYFLPGVPVEMRRMWELHIEPTLGADGAVILGAKINTFGMGESDVAEKLGELMARDRNPTVGTTVEGGVVSVRVRSAGDTNAAARRELEATCAEVEKRLGGIVFGHDDATLADAVGEMLKRCGRTVACAESCTGGLVGKMLTDRPGSSAYFLGSFVTYADAMKREVLGVGAEVLERDGAVSEAAVTAMAEGALDCSGADYAVSITGIAGPDGGSAQKPVGTVWFGLAQRGRPTVAERRRFPGERDIVRERSANFALNLLRLRISDQLL
jgi:competence/damage-inducible protein CinA-like protein